MYSISHRAVNRASTDRLVRVKHNGHAVLLRTNVTKVRGARDT